MFNYGDRVRISLPSKDEQGITYNMNRLQGYEAIVERVISFQGQRAYELYGVMSPKGKAYIFEEDWLEPIGKEQNDEADGTDHKVHR